MNPSTGAVDSQLIQQFYERAKNDLEFFARFFFPHLFTKEIGGVHRRVYADLNARHKFLALEMFRGAGKSTMGLIFKPIHSALFDQVGDISLISKSESFILNEVMRRIKSEFENNQKLIAMWGDLRTTKWSESYFVLKNGIAFEGKGIDGQLRGGRRGLICLDDLEDNETASSEEQRQKLRDRVVKELIPKLLPQGQMNYFGTPVHQLCYLHQIINTPNNGWEKRVYAAYLDGKEAESTLAWPQMYSHEHLQRLKKTMGSFAFATEYLCNPVSDETSPIKENQIRYWETLPAQYNGVIIVDPAYDTDEKSDFKVASVIFTDEKSNRYLYAYLRTHAPIGEFMDGILNLFLQHRGCITALGIPNSGIEKGFFGGFLKKCEERRVNPPIVEIKNMYTSAATQISVRNKKARIVAALQPLFEAGKYFIHSSHTEARDELLSIGQSRWDDIVDTLSSAEQILTPYFAEGYQTPEEQRLEEEYLVTARGDTGYGF